MDKFGFYKNDYDAMYRSNCINATLNHTWSSFIAFCVVVGCTGYFDAFWLTS